jgi:hypothetical protein
MNQRIAIFTVCLLFTGIDLTADDLPVEEVGKIPSLRLTCLTEWPGHQIDCHDFLLDHVAAGGNLQTTLCINVDPSSCNQQEIQVDVNPNHVAQEYIMVAKGVPGFKADSVTLPCVQKVTCVFDSVTGDCKTDLDSRINSGPIAHAINGQSCIGG